jgi:4-alpha-glucanotransferase
MIHLHWAIHNHQPVGNFDFIFERAYQQAYKPFLDVLMAHPRIRMSMHFSGILLDWLEVHRPEYIRSLRTVVERGQLEILGGGFYEPILPVISDADKIGQLRKLQNTVQRLFGVTPKGIWLAERVWEPTLVKPIAEAGIEFVVLDGSHFKMVGKTDQDMDGYFLSEDQGHTLKLFPIHDVIRDYIPFRSVDEVIGALLALNKPGDVQVVFGDDGEKFGDWPGTFNTVYADRWLHNFFEKAESLSDQIRILPLESGLKPEKNLGLVYLPPASYQEMMVWAQDAHDIPKFRTAHRLLHDSGGVDSSKFLRGTFWRNFFNKYSESNQIHKQGIRLSRILEHLTHSLSPQLSSEIQDHLWQSQCNCGYWHGVFGGLYLPHLRFALYRNLIQAQRLLDKAMFEKRDEPVWEVHDWNCDGKPEYTLNSREVFLSLTQNGEVDQFWLKSTGINLTDTLTRRFEAYHELVGGKGEGGTKLENQLGEKESNLRGYLVYDRKIRRSLADVFLAPKTRFDDYVGQKYLPAFNFEAKEVTLERHGHETEVRFLGIARAAEAGSSLRVEKSIILAKGSPNLRIEWRFTNIATGGAGKKANGDSAIAEFRFGCEALFCLLAGNAPDRYIEWNEKRDILASRGEMLGAQSVVIADEWLKLKTETKFSGVAEVWRDAIETVSQSEGGYERVYQGTVLIPVWDFSLTPGAEGSASMSIQFQEGA